MFNLFRLLVLFTLVSSSAYSAVDSAVISELETCKRLELFLAGSAGNVVCEDQYQIYSKKSSTYTKSKIANSGKDVRIAAFNIYKPGATETEYKDYRLVAEMVNKWDVMAAIELVANNGVNKKHNDAIVKYYSNKVTEFKPLMETESVRNELALIREQYDFPGYIRLLKELQKLDSSWSLVLSGNQEGSEGSTVKELSGFYFRADRVKLLENEYCSNKYGKSGKYGCLPKPDKDSFGSNVKGLMSRRPYLASFESGGFDFTLLATHVIFNTPSDEGLQERVIKAAFGVDDYRKVGPGVSQRTFARFAEIIFQLKLIENLKKDYDEQDYIILGDFNLKGSNNYWEELFYKFKGFELKIEGATSVAIGRYLSDGTITHGTSNNYDHFLFDPSQTRNCSGATRAKIFNFIEGDFAKKINLKYLVRSTKKYTSSTTGEEMYRYRSGGKAKAELFVEEYLFNLKPKLTVSNGKLVKRFNLAEKESEIKRRLFESQLFDKTYYSHLKQIISDHLPIYMNCSTKKDRD